MKCVWYRIFAEIIFLLHVSIVILGLGIVFLWNSLFWYYSLVFTLGLPSWIFLRRCFLTDFENWCRIQSGQKINIVERSSFLGYRTQKMFGKHAPNNRTIFWIIIGFYIVFTPVWLVSLYLHIIA